MIGASLSMPRPVLSILCMSLLAGLTTQAKNAETPSAWDLVALGLVNEAHDAFEDHPPEDRTARFGEAVTLINLQPKTRSNLDRAEKLLALVAAHDGDDELGVGARYYLARIAQFHRPSPDLPEALRIYHQLAASESRAALAQRALVQIALIELFEPGVPREEVAARFDRLALRGKTLTEPSARRDFNLVMGDAALRFELGDTVALDHLLTADETGLARPITQRDTWVRIAELARRAGRDETAITYYRRFADTFVRDSRNTMVSQRLKTLVAKKQKEVSQ